MNIENADILIVLGLVASSACVLWKRGHTRITRRLHLLLLTPFLPIAYLIDLIVGDFVTGIPRTPGQKLADHRRVWIEIWREP